MKRDRSVASGSTIEGGGAMLVSPSVSKKPGAVHPEPDRQWDETAWALLHKLRRAMAETEEILRQGSFKNLPDHLFRIKVFFGQLPGQSALVFVTGGDHVQALGCSLYSLESK